MEHVAFEVATIMKNDNNPIIYAFIDSQNLNLGVQSLGWKLDFGRFLIMIKQLLFPVMATSFVYMKTWKKKVNYSKLLCQAAKESHLYWNVLETTSYMLKS